MCASGKHALQGSICEGAGEVGVWCLGQGGSGREGEWGEPGWVDGEGSRPGPGGLSVRDCSSNGDRMSIKQDTVAMPRGTKVGLRLPQVWAPCHAEPGIRRQQGSLTQSMAYPALHAGRGEATAFAANMFSPPSSNNLDCTARSGRQPKRGYMHNPTMLELQCSSLRLRAKRRDTPRGPSRLKSSTTSSALHDKSTSLRSCKNVG